MMHKNLIYWEDLGAKAEYSRYIPNDSEMQPEKCGQGVSEYHVMLHVEARGNLFQGQLERLHEAMKRLVCLPDFEGEKPVFKRYFLSDAANQQPLIEAGDVAFSAIQQPPLDGSKVAMWVYLVGGGSVTEGNLSVEGHTCDKREFTVVAHNGYSHLYQWGLVEPEGDSYMQTRLLLEHYESSLEQMGSKLGYEAVSLERNCVRTWFYVRDVDTQYAGMVKARKENFIAQGLTEKSHYIASTGIGGVPADAHAIVQLGTYALLGFNPEQQRYLYAPTHLNPTYEYGVTFERGVVMEYGDRAQVFISGTASINNKGEVMHVGDIVKQTKRMLENVEVLLAEGGAAFDDVMQAVIYLRDLGDYESVKTLIEERLGDIPKVFTLAPVCRPTWLVEMECIAVAQRKNPEYREF